jgi:hypothetical protein
MPNVHKDFHGALSYGIRYLAERYGEDKMRAFLSGLGGTVYKPLADAIRERGLDAMRDHLEEVFTAEGGEFEFATEDETLVFHVHRCPAIHHMKEHGYDIAPHFCEHTRIVNEAICGNAGCGCSVDYDQEAGTCVQKFWRVDS